MKRIITILAILISTNAFSQTDSTKIKGLQLTARLLYYLAPSIVNENNDSLYQVYIDLRPKFRIVTPPVGAALVTLDSIPTVELAKLYQFALSTPEGYSMANTMKNQIAATRIINSYLDNLCTAFEAAWQNRLLVLIADGKKLLRGK
jgi:hypothetical protein